MGKFTRSLTAGTALFAACAFGAIGAGGVGAKTTHKVDIGTIYAAITHTVGKIEYAAGDSTDKVLGNGAVTFSLAVEPGGPSGTLTGKGNVTVYGRTGSLTGTDSVDFTISSTGAITFTHGKINLTKGAGLQKGHSFVGTFTGSGKSAAGPFVFHYKGAYK